MEKPCSFTWNQWFIPGPPLPLPDSYLLGSLHSLLTLIHPLALTIESLPNLSALVPCCSLCLPLSLRLSLFPLVPMLQNRVRDLGLRKAPAAPEPFFSILRTLTWLDVVSGLVRTEGKHCGQPCLGAYCLHAQEAAGDIDVVKIVPVQVTVSIPQGSEEKRCEIPWLSLPDPQAPRAMLPCQLPLPRLHRWTAPKQPIYPTGPVAPHWR